AGGLGGERTGSSETGAGEGAAGRNGPNRRSACVNNKSRKKGSAAPTRKRKLFGPRRFARRESTSFPVVHASVGVVEWPPVEEAPAHHLRGRRPATAHRDAVERPATRRHHRDRSRLPAPARPRGWPFGRPALGCPRG